jgi:hypothetical protein
MHPAIRIAVVAAALLGIAMIGRAAWTAVAGNLTALRSWTRAEGEVRAMNSPVEFELGQEPSARRAFATVEHTWGLSLFKKVPLFVDPADPAHIRTAGFLQMWLSPAGMAGLIVLLLAVGVVAARAGAGQRVQAGGAQWMFTESPGPLPGGVLLRSPARQWKIVMGWSLLGIAMALIPMFAKGDNGKGDNQVSRFATIVAGSAFTLALWSYAWHTRTLEVSGNAEGMRMTSVLGWRNVPWGLVHSVEDQSVFTTYYNGSMRMWELPFPGSTVRVYFSTIRAAAR